MIAASMHLNLMLRGKNLPENDQSNRICGN